MSAKKVEMVWRLVAVAIIVLVSVGVLVLSNSDKTVNKFQRGSSQNAQTVSLMETNCVNSVKNVFPKAGVTAKEFTISPVLSDEQSGSLNDKPNYAVDGFLDAELLIIGYNGEILEFVCTTLDPMGENVEWFRIA